MALADATDDEKTFIKKHWERLPDDYQLQARDRVCYPCQVIAPEIACRKSENWKKAMAQVRDKTWDAHYKQLQTFVAKEGHADCPHGYKDPTTGFDLGVWVQRQRMYKRKGTLSPEREKLLTELGVTWEGVLDEKSDKTWDAHYKQLQTFVAKEKHANCPHGYKDPTTGFGLGRWLATQRAWKREKTLLPEREELLTELGVTWNFRRGTKRKR